MAQILDAIHAAMVGDADDLDIGLQTAIDERRIVGLLGEAVFAALVLVRVRPRVHLERTFPEFRIIGHWIQTIIRTIAA